MSAGRFAAGVPPVALSAKRRAIRAHSRQASRASHDDEARDLSDCQHLRAPEAPVDARSGPCRYYRPEHAGKRANDADSGSRRRRALRFGRRAASSRSSPIPRREYDRRIPRPGAETLGHGGVSAGRHFTKKSEEVMTDRRELYRSPNGDAWFLGREPANGQAFIIHQPNAPSGGRLSHIELAAFLSSGTGPERQALLRLIGTLVDVPPYAERQ